MFDRLRALLLRLLRVPPEPEPPFGNPASIRVFRASRKYYLLRLLAWSVGQVGALLGILLWLAVVIGVEHEAQRLRAAREANPKAQATASLKTHEDGFVGKLLRTPPARGATDLLARVPGWAFLLAWVAEGIGIAVYLGQLGLTYASLRLDYEMRWYVVTDRSLRIRTGLWKVQEMTMSFANIQQVMVSQNPVQRLLQIADVRVQSAGGGAATRDPHQRETESLHTGIFHSVDNANEVRDLILERLRQFRETGLGDPDEHHATAQPKPTAPAPPPASTGRDELVLQAARELLEEARRLRSALAPKQW